jgi:hypothetical protein
MNTRSRRRRSMQKAPMLIEQYEMSSLKPCLSFCGETRKTLYGSSGPVKSLRWRFFPSNAFYYTHFLIVTGRQKTPFLVMAE